MLKEVPRVWADERPGGDGGATRREGGGPGFGLASALTHGPVDAEARDRLK